MTSPIALATPLPAPTTTRWSPLRLGLVNLYHYEAEEFWFRDGHLLLRGNNGTGKSKVLALTLPFLLDGDHSAARVEPDGDTGKRMEWNLLLEGLHEQRVGYSWIELGRIDEDGPAPGASGTERFLTLVCGLKATADRGVTGKWFAVADDLRVGEDLHLVDGNRLVLEKDRLREAVGGNGTVYDRVSSYRSAVRERLFGIAEDRYDALLRLLLQLRQPQLSKRPDEAALAGALTEALPPLDEGIVTNVAAAMAGLEDDREELRQLRQIQQVVGAFHRRYRRYARVVVRRASDRVRHEASRYEGLAREQRVAEEERDAAAVDADGAARAVEQARAAGRDGQATATALRADPTMRDARRLHEAAQAAQQARQAAQRSQRALEEVHEDVRARRRAASETGAAAEAAREDAERRSTEVALAADAAGIGSGHGQLVAVLAPATAAVDRLDADRLAAAERDAGRLADDRRRAVRRVRDDVRAAERVRDAAATARERRDDAESERAEAAGELGAAEDELVERRRALLVAAQGWAAATTELRLADLDAVLAATEEWGQDPRDQLPLRREAEEAAQARIAALAVERAAVERERDEAHNALAATEAEHGRLSSGALPTPAPSPVRPDRDASRPGAPLWRVLEFADELSAAERAGLEAALEAGGLLDAWVTPDGALLDPSTLDAVVVPGAPVGPAVATLTTVLRPSDDEPAVPRPAVERLLAGIGLGSAGAETAQTWVATDGRYRVGALQGAWAKDEARYVGGAAREAERRRLLAQLAAEAERLRGAIAAANGRLHGVDGRLAVVETERAALPSEEPVRAAAGAVDQHAARLRAATERVEREAEAATRAAAVAEAAETARDATAGELCLPTDEAGLAEVEEAVHRYRERLAALWPALGERARAEVRAQGAGRELSTTEERASTRAHEAERDRATADEAAVTATVLRETVGAAVEELQRRLAQAERQIRDAEEEARSANDARMEAEGRRAAAQERAAQLGVRAGEADERRRDAAAALYALAGLGLVRTAAPELEHPSLEEPWAVDPTVRFARRLDGELVDIVDVDATWSRESTRVTAAVTDLQTALSAQGASATAELRDEAYVVAVSYRGVRDTPDGILGVLDDEVAYSQRILDEREREVLENHLVAEVASHLVDRLRTAEELVLAINGQLAQRPTSTGMRLRLRWEEAGEAPEGLGEAKKRLRQHARAWTPGERQAVGTFLKRCLDTERERDEGASWAQTLTRAFDYRRWHTFGVLRSSGGDVGDGSAGGGNGSWRRATGPASGGERVLAMTLPLFAAASAFYDSAGEHAPRFVLLDEAFAGVDRAARASCLGLLDVFDLDYVLTSESEWGTYRDVGGLAICQLVRRPGVNAVHVSRWWWDGTRREPAAYATGSAVAPPTPRPPSSAGQEEALFDLER